MPHGMIANGLKSCDIAEEKKHTHSHNIEQINNLNGQTFAAYIDERYKFMQVALELEQ